LSALPPSKFKRELFGTDGIRGIAGEYPLDRPTVYAIGRALGQRLAEHAKEACQLSQMNIENKFRFTQRLRPHTQNGGDVNRFKNGIHRNTVTVLNQTRKV